MLQDLSAIRLIYGDSFADSSESFLQDISQLHEIFGSETELPKEDWYTFDLMTKTMEPNDALPYLIQQEIITSFGKHFYGSATGIKPISDYSPLI